MSQKDSWVRADGQSFLICQWKVWIWSALMEVDFWLCFCSTVWRTRRRNIAEESAATEAHTVGKCAELHGRLQTGTWEFPRTSYAQWTQLATFSSDLKLNCLQVILLPCLYSSGGYGSYGGGYNAGYGGRGAYGGRGYGAGSYRGAGYGW